MVNKVVQDKELCFCLPPGEQKWLSELTPLYRTTTIASELLDHRFDWSSEAEEEEGKEWLTVSEVLWILKRGDSQFQNDRDLSMSKSTSTKNCGTGPGERRLCIS